MQSTYRCMHDFAIVYRGPILEMNIEYAMDMVNLLRITILHNLNNLFSVNKGTGDKKFLVAF